MKEDMFKIANTVVRFVRNKVDDFREGGVKMINHRESLEEYNRMREERRQLISNTRAEIQTRIEKVCRQSSTLIVDDLGFENISSLLFEGSWQEKVMHMLQNDGYHCMMSFNYDGGQLRSCLTVSWEK